MSLIRGVLLAGKFRKQHELNAMSHDDQRNTLIVELSGRTNQPGSHFQSLDDATLAGTGAVLVFLREAKIRNDQQLKAMSDDDQRNILIVEIGSQTLMGSELQGLRNMDLVLMGLGKPGPGGLQQGSFIRGVLLAGKFRTQHDLNKMSPDDQRNTLIVELTAHSNQSNYQSFNDFDLAGMGAVLVFLRETKIRDDKALKTMSADDQRNTLIVEIDGQTHLGSRLQGLRNMDLVLAGLGVDPVFPVIPPRP
jgi:very-short-patch-repair endonuclease